MYYLRGDMDVGDSIEDEWVIAYIAYDLSKKHSNLIIQLFDDDGDYLLIEGAQTLPDWVDPTTMDNRFFLHDGEFKILPHPHYSSYSSFPLHPTIEQSLSALFSLPSQSTPSLQLLLRHRFDRVLSSLRSHTHTHTTFALLPTSWAALLSKPSILSLFARIFLDSTPLERQQASLALDRVAPTTPVAVAPIQLPQLLFLELIAADEAEESRKTSAVARYLKDSTEVR
ncbi:uncharacterized protein [Blastocystis hominis]|uniref:Uncharacterized protein n=1 Tax=Blastocystis hominis TaxID=12968 RepID=D8M7I0_BLAHO|nr:uncharacterized protein [Blastocystis hominis]CBK24019.2 unnamed protein product [Blastocystis hominis]|eukprot:XP_012898067.1 uncharacterized protein [Blastocystis hominis]